MCQEYQECDQRLALQSTSSHFFYSGGAVLLEGFHIVLQYIDSDLPRYHLAAFSKHQKVCETAEQLYLHTNTFVKLLRAATLFRGLAVLVVYYVYLPAGRHENVVEAVKSGGRSGRL